MSPELTNALSSIGTGIVIFFGVWIRQRISDYKIKETVKDGTIEVKDALRVQDQTRAAQVSKLETGQNIIHSLVNGGVQELKRKRVANMKDLVDAYRRFTESGSNPDDFRKLNEHIAELAEANIDYEMHLKRQAKVDAAVKLGEQIARGEITEEMLEKIRSAVETKKKTSEMKMQIVTI